MKLSIGKLSVFGGKRVLCHALERALHAVQMLPRSAGRREGGRFRLDDLTQFEQVREQRLVGVGFKNPRQHIRVQQVPTLRRADPSADLRPRVHQSFGIQDSDGLAIRRARYLQPFARLNFIVEQVAGRKTARYDADAQITGYRAGDAQSLAWGPGGNFGGSLLG